MTILEAFSLLGGVGLFLFGMSIMSSGLKNAAGDQMKKILEKATANKFIAVLVGIGVTIVIQSSSATDMMVIGFVNSGPMTLAQAIGVIMGANIGTTITAQIAAFNLGAYAPVILFLGAVMYLFLKKDTARHIGSIIMGFGMLFVGISTIKSAIAPLAESPGFVSFMSTLSNPALAVLFGLAFTALLQSSSSSVVIFQTFAAQGLIGFDMAVYLIIGAAIGSVTPNILASLTTNRNGKRTAVLNLLFNLFRAAILIALINIFPGVLRLIQRLSPTDAARQVANAHTFFALFAVIVELPFANLIVKLAQKIIPVRPEEMRRLEDRKLRYMVQEGRILPAVALDQARMEIARMGQIARGNLVAALDCFFHLNDGEALEVEDTEDTVNYLAAAITDRLGLLHTLDMNDRDRRRVSEMTLVVSDIERLSDHAENIIEYEQKVRSKKAVISDEGMAELHELSEAAMHSVDLCLSIFENESVDRLPEAEEAEQQVDDLQETIVQNHVNRLMKNSCDPMGGVVFTDMAIDLERCSDHAINIAQSLSRARYSHTPAP